MKTIFGPINSRRFGKSLGVDLSPSHKQCNFDCLYCELTPAKTLDKQSVVIEPRQILSDIQNALKLHKDIDVLTITANGEPTLYPHLKELISEINKIKGKTKTLILSNASTLANQETQNALMLFDSVKLSLDCATKECFKKLDRPDNTINLESIKEGMLQFKKRFSGNLIIEILLVATLNNKPSEIKELNNFLLKLKPNRIDIGTIDRPPAYNAKPLSYQELRDIAQSFDASLPIVVTTRAPKSGQKYNYSKEEMLLTLSHRPLTIEDTNTLFSDQAKLNLQELLEEKKVTTIQSGGTTFYKVKEQYAPNHNPFAK